MDKPSMWRRFVWFYNRRYPQIAAVITMLLVTELFASFIWPSVALPLLMATAYSAVMLVLFSVFT